MSYSSGHQKKLPHHADTYWPLMLDVARRFNITRIKKCCQIMGRMEGSLTSAQVLYPLMQCTDVFFLKADICQLGVDQRKVNMLAREYCDAARIKRKPVILSHHMLYGLKAGQEKMSKSDPDSAVFMEDSAEDVERKIMNAYCPNKEELTVAATTADAEGTTRMPVNSRCISRWIHSRILVWITFKTLYSVLLVPPLPLATKRTLILKRCERHSLLESLRRMSSSLVLLQSSIVYWNQFVLILRPTRMPRIFSKR